MTTSNTLLQEGCECCFIIGIRRLASPVERQKRGWQLQAAVPNMDGRGRNPMTGEPLAYPLFTAKYSGVTMGSFKSEDEAVENIPRFLRLLKNGKGVSHYCFKADMDSDFFSKTLGRINTKQAIA